MKRFILTGAALAASFVPATADLCSVGSEEVAGNWYCQNVKAVTYQGLGGSGSYNKVTNMDSTTGSCSSTPHSFSGSMAPWDEEVSLHFRGPLKLKQFAVYTPSGSSSTSSSKLAKRSPHHRRHGHEHFHEHNKEIREIQEREEQAKRDAAVGDLVIATIDGAVVSWINKYNGGAATSSAASSSAASSSAASSSAASSTTLSTATSAAAKTTSASNAELQTAPPSGTTQASKTSSSASSSAPVASGAWTRNAYYNAYGSPSADGLVFLNHNGGQGSGVFDYTFGNSLSYAASDASCGVASPEVLSDMTLPSDTEIVIMSDTECTDGSCGFVRDGNVAYHGFGGAQKAFFFEFSMPLDGNKGFNGDMPAIWMLNAQIPRTLQYGAADCSCWTSGCGEFDLFEVLDSGDMRCKSTLHSNVSGGDSDYFARPTSGTIQAVALFYNENVHIQILGDSFGFPTSIDSSTVSNLCSQSDTQSSSEGVSIFKLSS